MWLHDPTRKVGAAGTISFVGRSYESLWLWLGAAFVAVGAALLGVGGGFDATSKVHYSFWTSNPVIVALVLFGVAVVCLICAVREVPIPHSISSRAAHSREQQIVLALLTFLDGRRVLFDPWTIEEPTYVAASILQVRTRIDEDLASLRPDTKAAASLQIIRAACLRYLTRVPQPSDATHIGPGAINDLRASLRDAIKSLERDYQITMPGGTGAEVNRIFYAPSPRRTNPLRHLIRNADLLARVRISALMTVALSLRQEKLRQEKRSNPPARQPTISVGSGHAAARV
jgi:hypothetical protein